MALEPIPPVSPLPEPVLTPVPAPSGEPKSDTFWTDGNTGKMWRARVCPSGRAPNLVPNGPGDEPPPAPPSDVSVHVSVCLVDSTTKLPVVTGDGAVMVFEQNTRTFTEHDFAKPDFDPAAEIQRLASDRIAKATNKIDKQAALETALATWTTPTGTDPVPAPEPPPPPEPPAAPVIPPVEMPPPIEPVQGYFSEPPPA